MRLFLASQDLGDFRGVLDRLVGDNRKALVIGNTRDYCQDESKITNAIKKTLVNLANISIDAQRLDLRKYFRKSSELEKYIAKIQPGLIFSIGGSVYCLATAMHESGMDKIIQKGVQEDKFVYGGYSAGSMVTACDLLPYSVEERLSPEKARETYGIEPYTFGLKLIEEHIVPHANREDHSEANQIRLAQIARAGGKPILLNDTDVYLVEGEEKTVLHPGTK